MHYTIKVNVKKVHFFKIQFNPKGLLFQRNVILYVLFIIKCLLKSIKDFIKKKNFNTNRFI